MMAFFLLLYLLLCATHAPRDFKLSDYFRFSRDGVAYMFKDFSSVVIYPTRKGRSSALSLIFNLKRLRIHNFEWAAWLLDAFTTSRSSLTSTGFVVVARKMYLRVAKWLTRRPIHKEIASVVGTLR